MRIGILTGGGDCPGRVVSIMVGVEPALLDTSLKLYHYQITVLDYSQESEVVDC